ncbi:lipoate--protein ligase family protein [Bifidobacterium platyrrhinorum]
MAGDAARHVRIDGDFFIEADCDVSADALLRDIEHVLLRDVGRASGADHDAAPGADADPMASGGLMGAVDAVTAMVEEALDRHPRARLVGTDATAIATAYIRARGADPVSYGHGANDSIVKDSAITADDDALLADRWNRLWPGLEIVHDVPRMPAEQMAVDERWARKVAAGERRPTLRIWEWAGPCVVVGRFQSVPDEVHEDVARAEGIEVVRRCTGGGAMFIEPGNTITYSLYAPLWFVDGMDVADSYRLCDRWLVGALRGLGLDVRFAGLNDLASQHGKIGGAAQRRFPAPKRRGAGEAPGAVLHHVTMAYDIDAAKMGRVLNTSREKMSDKAVQSAVKRVDPMRSQTGMTRTRIVGYLLDFLHAHAGAGVAGRGEDGTDTGGGRR